MRAGPSDPAERQREASGTGDGRPVGKRRTVTIETARGLELSWRNGRYEPVASNASHSLNEGGCKFSQPGWFENSLVTASCGASVGGRAVLSPTISGEPPLCVPLVGPASQETSTSPGSRVRPQTTAGAGSASLPVTAAPPGSPGGPSTTAPPGSRVRPQTTASPASRVRPQTTAPSASRVRPQTTAPPAPRVRPLTTAPPGSPGGPRTKAASDGRERLNELCSAGSPQHRRAKGRAADTPLFRSLEQKNGSSIWICHKH